MENVNVHNYVKLVSFDINRMFSKIPFTDCYDIILELLANSTVNPIVVQEMVVCLNVISSQCNNKTYLQMGGLAMDSPLNIILADIFITHFLYIHIRFRKHTDLKYLFFFKFMFIFKS